MVGADVRQVESEIDSDIQNTALWKVEREVLLHRLMTVWRDSLELLALNASHAAMFGLEGGLERFIAGEYLLTTGVYQTLKWAMLYASDDGSNELPDVPLIQFVMKTAEHYQILVDALKLGAHDQVEFSVDQNEKTLTIYEGGDVSGHDNAMLDSSHLVLPFHTQSPLVDDADQLTRGWTAGQYREYWRWLRSFVEAAEKETIMAQAGPIAPMQEIMKRRWSSRYRLPLLIWSRSSGT